MVPPTLGSLFTVNPFEIVALEDTKRDPETLKLPVTDSSTSIICLSAYKVPDTTTSPPKRVTPLFALPLEFEDPEKKE